MTDKKQTANAWKYATVKEVTTYERSHCEKFEPTDYVIVEMYVEDLEKDIRSHYDQRIGNLTKQVQVLGFLDMDGKPLKDVLYARSIADRNLVYMRYNPVNVPRYPYIWVCPSKFKLTTEVCQNTPHYHIIRYTPISDEEVTSDLQLK